MTKPRQQWWGNEVEPIGKCGWCGGLIFRHIPCGQGFGHACTYQLGNRAGCHH